MNGKVTGVVALVGLGLLVWWLMTKAPFKVGDRVKSVPQPSLLGTVVGIRPNPGGGWNVDVQWDDGTFASFGGNLDLVIALA